MRLRPEADQRNSILLIDEHQASQEPNSFIHDPMQYTHSSGSIAKQWMARTQEIASDRSRRNQLMSSPKS
jgi:hypothetical protein